MAVDLTTGSYDEEGIFSKHNDIAKQPQKITPVNDFCSLKNFRVLKVLKECSQKKTIVVEGHFVGDEGRAIVAIEKMPFDSRDINRMFTADSRIELKFRNDIYAKYHVYPPNGFNGISVKVIHPANEKDFSKFIEEQIVMVYEMKVLYDSVVRPYFKARFEQQTEKEMSSDTVIFSSSFENTKFVLMKEENEDCSCSSKHIRAKAVISRPDLLSLRDLLTSDIPLLVKVQKTCLEKLSKTYGIPTSQLLSYVFYPPQSFPFQMTFESIEKDEKIPVGKAHHVDSIVSNLRIVPDYYQKVVLSYFISEKEPLGQKLSEIDVHSLTNK